jgi:DNA-binding IscR family transcriptional regulator
MLALKPQEYFSSELIARSVGTNSVVVRRLLARLQKAGFVACQAGVHGGAKLNVDPRDVTLLNVFDSVEQGGLFRVHSPHPECPVACSVKEDVHAALAQAEKGMRSELSRVRLSRITRRAKREYQQWVV